MPWSFLLLGQNALVGWFLDRLECQGVGRSPVRFLAPRRSVWGDFFVNFGMSWDVSGSGLGTFSDGFGMVLEKMSDGVEK